MELYTINWRILFWLSYFFDLTFLEARTEMQKYFCSFFGVSENFKKSFPKLTFLRIVCYDLNKKKEEYVFIYTRNITL